MKSRLDFWIVIFVGAMASLGAVLLGLGQHSISLSMVAVFCVVASAICTDYLNWFHLSKSIAGALASLAVLAGFYRFSVAPAGEQLLVVADLLIYLQMILFFQQKNSRLYWHICLLSLLQVVVSAALNLYVAFGGLLVLYLFLAVGSATLLFFREEVEWHRAIARRANRTEQSSPRILKWVRQRWLGGGEPGSRHDGGGVVLRPEQRQGVEQVINLSLAYQMGRFALLTLALTFLMFFLFPRFGDSAWQTTAARTTRLVGYSGNVSLTEFGKIHESPEEVMRVQFTDEWTGEPVLINREPYFRGDVLTQYRPMEGTWAPRLRLPSFRRLSPPPESTPNLVRQSITLETPAHLFSLVPVYLTDGSAADLRFDPDRSVLVRDAPPGFQRDDPEGKQRHYEVLTTAFRLGMQRPVIPETRRQAVREAKYLAMLDTRPFPVLAQTAADVLEAAGVDSEDRVAAARALEAHLRSADYFYTFDLTYQPPAGVDPIEYFVAEHRQGHCEYFASALVLMCRSQKIPARLVVGYRGGEYNRIGEYYLVRELHAHAWVEVYLEPEQVPEQSMLVSEPRRFGAWLRLDPTPGVSNAPTPVGDSGVIGRFAEFKDFVQLLWRDYFVGLDRERQREAIYGPITSSVSTLFNDMLLSREWWGAFGETVSQRIGLGSWDRFREQWLSWWTIPIVLITLAVLYAVIRIGMGLRIALAHVLRRFSRQRSSWGGSKELEFYRRWERLAGRLKIRRAPHQTHQEMTARVAGHLQACETGRSVESINRLTQTVVQSFYRARFGRERLSPQEVSRLDRIVRQLTRLAGDTRSGPSSDKQA
ncbi:MAG: DUF3488 and transglutaminase-like domain-containing protein [Planctomycetota bacterium]